MELKMIRPGWGGPADFVSLCRESAEDGFDGVEAQLPREQLARSKALAALKDFNLLLITEVATGDWWVAKPTRTRAEHLADLDRALGDAAEAGAIFVNAMTGSDAWGIERSVDFLGEVQARGKKAGIVVSVETHRSRSLFNPWTTAEILRQLPELPITCDLSHFVVVTERLVMDEEPEILALLGKHVNHIHCRVGYEQGPQVPDPRAPEFAAQLSAHERWWDSLWEARRARGCSRITMNPEFGVDNYMHLLPFTGQPVSDLRGIVRWMGERERERFGVKYGGQRGRETV
jgi:sugar phosphate isomerase/epimerase